MPKSDTITALHKRVEELKADIKSEVLATIRAEFLAIFEQHPCVVSLAWEQDDEYYDDETTYFRAMTDEAECFTINGIKGWELTDAKCRQKHNLDADTAAKMLKAADLASRALVQVTDELLEFLAGVRWVTVTREGITLE